MSYYLIGIGGVGMSALAEILLQKGERVSGSDSKRSAITENLIKKGVKIAYRQERGALQGEEIVVYSTDIKPDHPEWLEAKEKKCLLLHRSELLEKLLSSKKALGVAGAHGKTTTSALLAYTLLCAEADPSYVIGGFSPSLAANGRKGKGSYFVAEADESDGSFLRMDPKGALITNVDYDHLDYWKSKEALEKAYQAFITKIQDPRLFFYYGEDRLLSRWHLSGTGYGFSPLVPLRARDLRLEGGKTLFTIDYQGESVEIALALVGRHNVLNALGVFGMARELGVAVENIKKSFSTFCGVGRRLEYRGVSRGASIYDDYAHHPAEITATLAALKEMSPHKRRITIFQPHRYTRLRDFLEEFVGALGDEHHLLVTDVYSAGEKEIEGVTIDELLSRLPKTARYVPREQLTHFVQNLMQEGDLVVTLGAGDITHVSCELSQS